MGGNLHENVVVTRASVLLRFSSQFQQPKTTVRGALARQERSMQQKKWRVCYVLRCLLLFGAKRLGSMVTHFFVLRCSCRHVTRPARNHSFAVHGEHGSRPCREDTMADCRLHCHGYSFLNIDRHFDVVTEVVLSCS